MGKIISLFISEFAKPGPLPKGNLSEVNCYYDSSGRLIKETSYDDVVNFEYNADGKLVKEVCRGYVITFEYDSAGNLIKEFTKDGDYEKVLTYEYDAAGNLVKEFTGNVDVFGGSATCTCEYDDNGELIKVIQDYGDGSNPDISTITVSYNDKGNKVRHTRCVSLLEYTYEYDQSGRVIEKKYIYKTDDPYSITRSYEYDSDGRLVKETSVYPDDMMLVVKYHHHTADE
jgi:YD repeat-containing protein